MRLVYDFYWGFLNEQVKKAPPKESMLFLRALHCMLDCILEVDPALGPAYIVKVDLYDAYMRIWVHLEDISM